MTFTNFCEGVILFAMESALLFPLEYLFLISCIEKLVLNVFTFCGATAICTHLRIFNQLHTLTMVVALLKHD